MDSGWSWIVMMASFLTRIMTDGMMFSFGIIMSELVLVFNESVAKTAWISSILSGTTMLAGPLASALTDHFGFRAVIIAGSVLGCGGLSGSYFIQSMDMLFLTAGLTCGVGFSLVNVAASMSINFYFERKRALATGFTMCASGLGTILFAPFNVWLINNYGLRGTFLILGAMFLNCAVLGALIRPVFLNESKKVVGDEMDGGQLPDNIDGTPLLIKISQAKDQQTNVNPQPNEQPTSVQQKDTDEGLISKRRSFFRFYLFKSPAFVLVCVSSFIQSFGFYVPYMYLSAHAVQHGMSQETGAFLLSIVGICMTIGRLIYGFVGDHPKVNIISLHNWAMSTSGILTIIVPYCTTYETSITFSVLFGLTVSCVSVVRPLMLVKLVGLENTTSAFGFMLLFYGLSGTFGVPLAGLLHDVIGNYDGTFYYGGSVTLLSAIVCYPIGWLHRNEKRTIFRPVPLSPS